MKASLARAANHLYDQAPRLYRVLYEVYKRWSDREERSLMAEVLASGMTAIDVGANIGSHARYLAELVGPTGRVLAFEPEPRNVAWLTRATADLPQVTVVQAAVSATTGHLDLWATDDLNVDHRTYDPGEEGRRRVSVPGWSLDGYLSPGERVHFIKMDIQGAELLALQGARRLLSENPGLHLLLEYWPYGMRKAGTDPAELARLLADHGFACRVLSGEGTGVEDVGQGPEDYVNVHAYPAPRSHR